MSIAYHCFYTPGTAYEQAAEHCVPQFVRYGVDARAVAMPHFGRWNNNCIYRSVLLHLFWRDIVWKRPGTGIGLLDSDFTVVRDPVFLKEFPGDVFVRDKGPAALPCTRYAGGMVAFRDTPGGHAALRYWAELCMNRSEPVDQSEMADQEYLKLAVDRAEREGAKIFRCPLTYIVNRENYSEGDDTVIVHEALSRSLKKSVNKGS